MLTTQTNAAIATNDHAQAASAQQFIPGDERPMEIIKVSANSRSTAVAGAIAGVIRESGRAEVQAIGASAVNQAIKAIAIARGYLELDNLDIVCVPSFTEVDISGNERTAVRLSVEVR
jgi:stage V sporulation protein S